VAVLTTNEGRYQLSQFNEDFSVYMQDSLIILEGNGENPRFFKFKNDLSFSISPAKENEYIIINNKFHENGKLEFFIKDGVLQLISHLALSRYLSYVVPNEILTKREEDYEAIKAQTIAARTYVLRALKSEQYFDVYADVRDQVYLSGIEIDAKVLRAIEETSNMVITYQNNLIDAKFCSSLGGRAERPLYLDSTISFDHSVSIDGDFVGQISPFFRWQESFSVTEIKNNYLNYFNENLIEDSLQNYTLKLEIKDKSISGRIINLNLYINNEKKELRLLEIRKFFSRNNKILPSTLFYFEYNNDNLIIYGAGNGHGIGMGQWEALDLSRKNYNFMQILDFFYPHTQIISYKSLNL
jgi:stage II sporulation protein D